MTRYAVFVDDVQVTNYNLTKETPEEIAKNYIEDAKAEGEKIKVEVWETDVKPEETEEYW